MRLDIDFATSTDIQYLLDEIAKLASTDAVLTEEVARLAGQYALLKDRADQVRDYCDGLAAELAAQDAWIEALKAAVFPPPPPVEEPPTEPPDEEPTEPPPPPPPPDEEEEPPPPPPPPPPPDEEEPPPPPIVIPPTDHGYFDALIAHPSFWKGYSLRPKAGEPKTSPYYEKQYARKKDGGYTDSNSDPIGIAYDATVDGAKVTIPAFTLPGTGGIGTLATAIDATATTFVISNGYGPLYNYNGRALKLGDEILKIVKPADAPAFDRVTGVIYVQRGQYGTTASAHEAGEIAHLSINTVPTALYLPLGTEDGHTYLVTWDGLWTDSYLKSGLSNHKAFNFLSSAIWLEPNTQFAGGSGAGKVAGFNPATDVAAYQVRSYNKVGGPAEWSTAYEDYAGPGVTAVIPVTPQRATFTIKPNRWTRFWAQIEQRANDYDLVSMWIADTEVEPVQILDRVPLSVRKGTIDTFVVEFNTSTDTYVRGNQRDLVAYVRNVAALQDAGDVTPFLVKP